MAIRESLLKCVAEKAMSIDLGHPTRVAVDGVDAAGKTVFAEELKARLVEDGRDVIRASVDGFHNPRRVRHQRGRMSPEGYYIDSFNYRALLDYLLLPLGPGGDLVYREAIFDYRTDRRVDYPPKKARVDSILVFDGVFLLRPELVSLWDLRIYLDISYDEMMRRGLQRGMDNGEETVDHEELYAQRYIPGQKLYHLHSAPKRRADIIIDNNDPRNPRITHLNPRI